MVFSLPSATHSAPKRPALEESGTESRKTKKSSDQSAWPIALFQAVLDQDDVRLDRCIAIINQWYVALQQSSHPRPLTERQGYCLNKAIQYAEYARSPRLKDIQDIACKILRGHPLPNSKLSDRFFYFLAIHHSLIAFASAILDNDQSRVGQLCNGRRQRVPYTAAADQAQCYQKLWTFAQENQASLLPILKKAFPTQAFE